MNNRTYMTDQKEYATLRFHFFDFLFTPLKENESTDNSHKILKKCIDRINEEYIKKQTAIVIDRHEGRTDEEHRNIFMTPAGYNVKERRYKCKISLLRDNKIPILVNKTTFALTPLEKLGNTALAETTNFYIDMNKKHPIVCCEFNSLGPRISDIEYYFRQVAFYSMLGLAKSCKAAIHMKLPINEVLSSLSDVLRFKIKVRPKRLNYLFKEVQDSFITNMNALAGTVKPKYIRVDAFFREFNQKDNPKNTQAILLSKRILNAIKNDNDVIDDFEEFTLFFEKDDGTDGIFQLIRGKQEITVKCPYKSPGNIDSKALATLVNENFSLYLDTYNN